MEKTITIPTKFRCRECEGEGTLVLGGMAGGEWEMDCPSCSGGGYNDAGLEYKLAQDEIARKAKAQKEKYETAIAETRQRRQEGVDVG